MTVESLNRTLDQELAAFIRGVSLECLVCGEFVLHVRGALACPECRSILAESRGADRRDRVTIRRAGRVTAGSLRGGSRKVRTPQGRTLGCPSGHTQAAKADGKWNRKETAGRGQPRSVRVKRWGKSPPAVVATRPASQTPSGAR